MPERPRKPLFPNPFYVVLLASSTLFVVTALAYCVSPWALGLDPAGPPRRAAPGSASKALALWLDRRGPLALGVEFAVMLLFGVLAMATDHWFPAKPARKDPEIR